MTQGLHRAETKTVENLVTFTYTQPTRNKANKWYFWNLNQ